MSIPTPYLKSGYSPQDMRAAYGFTKLPAWSTGTNEVIAIIDAYGSQTIQADLDAFCAKFKIPSCAVNVYYVNGNYPDYTPTADLTNWVGETTLDVEWAHAMAPDAQIDLVVAHDPSWLYTGVLWTTTFLQPNVVSMSWGGAESAGETNADFLFTNPTITFIAASGDNMGTNYPAASPYVLGVGGTSMKYNTTSGAVTETAWYTPAFTDTNGIFHPAQGGGGGVSQFEPEPV